METTNRPRVDYKSSKPVAVEVVIYGQRLTAAPEQFLGIPHATVRLKDVADFYTYYNFEVDKVIFQDDNGTYWYSFGKAWKRWNGQDNTWELARIGAGAYGDGTVWRDGDIVLPEFQKTPRM